jgi:hypothetical protein
VIGVAKDNLRAQFFERFLGHALYGCQGSHRHEYGSLNFPVCGQQMATARSTVDGIDVERERHQLAIVAMAGSKDFQM